MIKMEQFNCPNCGAPIASDVCPYCGTAFLDWSCLELHKDNWIKIKIDGKVCLIKATLTAFGIDYDDNSDNDRIVYMDNHPMYFSSIPTLDLHFDLSAKPFKIPGYKDSLMIEIDPSVANLHDVGDILKRIKNDYK